MGSWGSPLRQYRRLTALCERLPAATSAIVVVATLGATCAARANGDAGPPELLRAPSPYDRDRLAPLRITLYGLFSAGLIKRDRYDAPEVGFGSGERSRLGLRGMETLDRGLRAWVEIEATLPLAAGPGETAGLARAIVGLGDRSWGRLDLGHVEHEAWLLSLRADPWGGNGQASPQHRMFVLAFDPAKAIPGPPASFQAPRSPATVTWRSPDELPLRASLQWRRAPSPDVQARGSSGSLAWDRLPWLVGVGWSHVGDGAWAVPLVVSHDDGVWRLSAAYTRGRAAVGSGGALREYENMFVGGAGTWMALGDPARHEWRVGMNWHRPEGRVLEAWRGDVKLSAGWRYRFSRHAWVAVGAAWVRPDGAASRSAFDATLSYSFERNLWEPQRSR